jgi:hypothetical protein
MNYNLRPGEIYPTNWIPNDPNDAATYYPQSVFRNASSQATIATVNLTKQSSGSYTGNFSVPRDASGLGFYITETVKVYTDSGHTALSNTYAQEQRIHKIKEELQNYGGTADRTDYNYIEKLIKRLLEDSVGKIKFKQKETDLSGIVRRLDGISRVQDGLPLDKILERLGSIENKKPLPYPDYSGHFAGIVKLVDKLEKLLNEKHGLIEPTIAKHLASKNEIDFRAREDNRKQIKESISELRKDLMDEMNWRFENIDSMVYKKKFVENIERPKKRS